MVTYVRPDTSLLYWDKVADGTTLLLISSDQATRSALAAALGEDHYQVVECFSGEEALDHFRYHDDYTMILVDDSLPGLSGYETCRLLRQHAPSAMILLLVSSAHDDYAVQLAFEVGATDYLAKPIRTVVARHRIQQLISLRAAESALRINEERYRSIARLAADYAYEIALFPNGATEGITQGITDVAMELVWVTRSFQDITGYAPQEIAETGWVYLIHPDDFYIAQARLNKLMAGLADVSEFRIVTRSGDVVWVRDRAQPVAMAQDGQRMRVYGVAEDITQERAIAEDREQLVRKLQAAVRQQEETNAILDTFFASAPVGLALFDTEVRFRRLNQALADINGMPIKAHLGNTPYDLLPNVDVEGTATMFQRVLETGEPVMFETSGWTHSEPGKMHYWLASYYPIRLRDEVLGVGAVVLDITPRKEAERAITASEQHLRRVLDSVVAFVGVLKPDGTLIEANRPALEAAGLRADQVLDRPFEDTYWWEYSPEIQQQLRDAIKRAAQGEVSRYDVQVRVGDNHFMVIDFMLAPMTDDSGHITHLIPSATDITERKSVEEALRLSGERFRTALKSAPVFVFTQDLNQRYTWLDSPVSGFGTDNLIGKTDFDLLERSDEAELLASMKRHVMEFGVGLRDEVSLHFGGQQHYFDMTIEPLSDIYGNISGTTCAAIDITQRKHDQETLRHQAAELRARNEELDAFAYTVAHDLKNPIATMMGFASLMQTYHSMMSSEEIQEYIKLIMEGGYKLRSIIDSLLLLAGVNKLDRPDIERLDMDTVVDGARSRLLGLIEETNAEIILPETWPIAFGYAPWVEEVVTNYLSNALKYGGTPPRIEFGGEKNGRCVRFWVRDNGGGLTPEEQAKVFTPFTRLSQVKIEGHGLGLSIVERIITRLGGEVGVESEKGSGCTFYFTLPLRRS